MKIMLDRSPRQIAECSERYGYDFWQLRTPLTRNKLSAIWMGQLADMLNNVDACDEESDKWTSPIIERVKQIFPTGR